LRAPQKSLGENLGSLHECALGFASNTNGYTGFAWCRDDATCLSEYRCIYYGKQSATYLTSSAYKKGDIGLVIDKSILVSSNEDGARQCNQAKKDHTVATADDMCAKGADSGGVMQYYSVMDGIKAAGHDLGAATTKTDRDSCAEHCAKTATCVAFTWTATGTLCQPKSKKLRDRYDPTWTNYDTEIKIETSAGTQYGELIETYERDKKDTWDTYELIDWAKPRWYNPGECEHKTTSGDFGKWFNICPRLSMNPSWCYSSATGWGCEYNVATMSQYLSDCRWVRNDQSYNYVSANGENSAVPPNSAALKVKNYRCVPSKSYTLGHSTYAAAETKCIALVSRATCENAATATKAGSYRDDFRRRYEVWPYEGMIKVNALASA
jgi:hypothetical protein